MQIHSLRRKSHHNNAASHRLCAACGIADSGNKGIDSKSLAASHLYGGIRSGGNDTDIHHSCFIETADHCQRGSALSTYFLTLELGISIGLFTSLMTAAPQNPVCEFTTDNIYYILLTSSIIAALSYFFITKKYISDKIERNM